MRTHYYSKRIIKVTSLISIFLIQFIWINLSKAQNVAITDDDSYTAANSAMLDVKSDTKGMLVPRLNTAQRTAIVEPATGLLVFDISLNSFMYYNGNDWITIPQMSTAAGADEALFAVVNALGDTVFAVYNDGAKVVVPYGTKGKVGGFAVSGRTSTKAGEEEYLKVTPDSTRIFINENDVKGKVGGFAVSGRTSTKDVILKDYFVSTSDSTRIYIDTTTTKGKVGGFAVSGRTSTKAGFAGDDYFNISANTSADNISSDARIAWYPKKEAFLAGRVLVQHPDSVGLNAFATGYHSMAKGSNSQAFGYISKARGNFSTAIGKEAIAHKDNSFAFGYKAQALGNNSFALGEEVIASGVSSYAFGACSRYPYGVIINRTEASSNNSFAFGVGARATTGPGNFSLGTNTLANGSASAFALGTLTTASGQYSFVSGYNSTASGDYSYASGYKATASGENSTAMGYESQSTGISSLAIGREAKSQSTVSTSIGYRTVASGFQSTAIGYDSDATSDGAVSIGTGTLASAPSAMALGVNTQANQAISTAMGYASIADAQHATTIGYATHAQSYASFVIGKYNVKNYSYSPTTWVASEPLFVIGNGQTDAARSNAFMVLKNADTYVYKDLNVSGQIYSSGWLRVYGSQGLYFQDYGGGWYMKDTEWIRSYGSKSIYHDSGKMRTDGTFQVGSSGGTLNVVSGGNFSYRTDVLFANTSGRVGIGTSSPSAMLHIVTAGTARQFRISGAPSNSYTEAQFAGDGREYRFGVGGSTVTDGSANKFYIWDNNSSAFRLIINTLGRVGIGTTNPLWKFHSVETSRLDNYAAMIHHDGNSYRCHGLRISAGADASSPSTTYMIAFADGDNTAVGSISMLNGSIKYNTSSDKRLKTNIKSTYLNGLETIKQMPVVDFAFKDNPDAMQTGFIAQDIEKVFPEAVTLSDEGFYQIALPSLVPVLTKAIQEQQQIIEIQQQEISDLKSQMEQITILKSELEAIKDLLRSEK